MKRPGIPTMVIGAIFVGIPMGIIGAVTLTASSSEEDLGEKYTHAVQRAWNGAKALVKRKARK